jgi:hypothetical protein
MPRRNGQGMAGLGGQPVAPPEADTRSVDGDLLSISPETVAGILMLCVGVLVAAGITTTILKFGYGFHRYTNILNLDGENNIPAWFSSLLLAFCAFLLLLIVLVKRNSLDPWLLQWKFLSSVFVMLSADEVVQAHERAIALREPLGLGGPFYFAWVLPAAILVVIFGFAYLRFVIALPHRTRWLFVVAAAMFVGGALGMEMIDGAYASAYGEQNLTYALLTCGEEALEMAGLAVFAYALIDYVRLQSGLLKLNFDA